MAFASKIKLGLTEKIIALADANGVPEWLKRGTLGQVLISQGFGVVPIWGNSAPAGDTFNLTSSNEVVIARQSVYNVAGFYDLGDISNQFWLGGVEYNVTLHYNNSVSSTLAGDNFQAVYGITPALPANTTIVVGQRWRNGSNYTGGHHYDLTLRSSTNQTVVVPNRASQSYYGHEGGATSSAKYAAISSAPFLNSSRYTTKVYTPSNINSI